LAAFVEARLAEDEQIAKAAADRDGREWAAGEDGHTSYAVYRVADGFAVAYDEGAPDEGEREHLARHDPARVLREVAAKRRVLADHHVPTPGWPFSGWPARACTGCGADRWEEPLTEDVNGCYELRNLASVWSDHPDYDESWRL
jgi:hypothetical protein